MINYWWAPRPKMKLDSIPEVLGVFSKVSLNQRWAEQRETHLNLEEALEEAGLKREGSRRDQKGSGGRTYAAWLKSLGLIFAQKSTSNIHLTLAGEAIMNGESPVQILRNQVLKYQFPSSYSIGRGVDVDKRFRIRPFRFMLKLLMDNRIAYLTRDELAKIVVVEADKENKECYERVVNKILDYRTMGDAALDSDFIEKYSSSRNSKNLEELFGRLDLVAGTFMCWIEYTQLAYRDIETKHLEIIPERIEEVKNILSENPPFINEPGNHELYQRRYGLDLSHSKDMRNLEKTKTVTEKMIREHNVRQAYLRIASTRPVALIDRSLIEEIREMTGYDDHFIEMFLKDTFPHGSIGTFMASYFELAFNGRDDAIEFEKATTVLFSEVFGFESIHLGQTGSKSTPDILIVSETNNYQAVVDNKAYSKYSISNDHHNRMVHNYIEKIDSYSSYNYPIGFFLYVSGGFASGIDRQLKAEIDECGVRGSGISVSNFIKMIENQTSGVRKYSHNDIKEIFGLGREVLLQDIC